MNKKRCPKCHSRRVKKTGVLECYKEHRAKGLSVIFK